LVATSSSWAAAPGYEIGVGVIESDNIERAQSGGTRGTVLEQELNFVWHEQRPLLNADIQADLSHLTYLPHTFPDEVVGNLIGQARLALVPQWLFWSVTDNFGTGVIDPLAAVTPGNRENINIFTTGPEARLPLWGTNLLDVRGTYGRATYQKSDLDANRYSAALGFIHQLSAQVATSINVHDASVRYVDDIRNTDYNIQEAFVHLDAKGSRTMLGADLGYGRVRTGGSWDSNPIGRLMLTRRVSASSSLSLSFGYEYSDSVGAFQISQVLNGANLNTQQTVQTTGPSTSRYGTIGWNFARGRMGFGISLSHFKDKYLEQNSLDDDRAELDANIVRQLTPNVHVALTEQCLRQTFTDSAGTAHQSSTNVRLSWLAARRVTVSLDYAYNKRTSQSSGFTENMVWLSIGYGRPAELPPGVLAPALPHPTKY
jgi:hypothetical protein